MCLVPHSSLGLSRVVGGVSDGIDHRLIIARNPPSVPPSGTGPQGPIVNKNADGIVIDANYRRLESSFSSGKSRAPLSQVNSRKPLQSRRAVIGAVCT